MQLRFHRATALGRFWLLSVGLAVGVLLVISAESEAHTFHHENVLGTSLKLHVDSPSLFTDRKAEATVLGEIDRLSGILSSYSETSELSAFLNGPETARKVSRELIEVLSACDHWKAVSGGAFNPAAELLGRLWGQSARQDRLPSQSELAEAVRLVGVQAWEIDASASTVTRRGGVPLTLDAIAKGYIIDRACRAALAESSEIAGLLLDIGGDLRVWGDAARSIGIADPLSPADNAPPLCWIVLRDAAVATSGNYARGFEIDGVHYSHIIDPRSGRPVDEVTSATVIAPEGAQADVLATILNVLAPEEGIRLVDRLKSTECLIVTEDGTALKSSGWERYSDPVQHPAFLTGFAAPAEAPEEGAEEPAWGNDSQFVVEFQYSRTQRFRYNRPYVAVWIEDAEGKAVRTLCLWVGDLQWLWDLRRWSSHHGRDGRFVQAVSRATRSPGKYGLIWDGRANGGKFVPAGKYNVCIEAVREHGGYGLIRQPVEIGKGPFAVDMRGNYEIRRASVKCQEKKSPQEGQKAPSA